MPYFIINKNQQSSGDYEVHNQTAGCSFLPHPDNRIGLGHFSNCHGAVRAAKSRFPQQAHQINGCYYCARACHTG